MSEKLNPEAILRRYAHEVNQLGYHFYKIREARVAYIAGADAIAERDQLRAELEKLRCELDDAEERASEAEERCAAEWEKDCGQALRLLAQVTKFEWDQDGSPADEVREHIQITIESLEKQVVALRAELAAAKEEADKAGFNLADAKGEIAVLSRKLEDCQAACASHETANKHYYEKLEKALAEGRALAADNERLRKVLELWQRIPFVFEKFGEPGELVVFSPVYYHNSMSVTRDALTATPAQSLSAHDAALLREVARLVDDYSGETLRAEADRIEQEAQRG